MKRSLLLLIALLFAFVGLVNAQSFYVDFENGDFGELYDFEFQNDTEYPWYVEFSEYNGYCMQSGNAGMENSSSAISVSVLFAENGYMSFEANCMGEGDFYDVCQFYIDGELQFSYGVISEGWRYYGFDLSFGLHQFTWIYTKDGSVNPNGDCFQVDNIYFEGVDFGCVAPTTLLTMGATDFAYANWDGYSDSYTLRYRKDSGSWNVVEGITSRSYLIEDLTPGNYTIEVWADCEPDVTFSKTCMVYQPYSWSDWYSFSNYCYYEDYYRRFVQFKMDDITNVTSVSNSYDDGNGEVFAAAFVNGDVWFVRYNYSVDAYVLYKAPVDMWLKYIGAAEIVKPVFEWAQAMSYNAANNWIYYIDSDGYLKRFKPENINRIEICGEIGYVEAFAINKKGQAFACVYDATTEGYALYSVNLANASKTKVGLMDYYVSDMAFDMLTGELFATNDDHVFYINTSDALMSLIGILGDEVTCEVKGLFMTYPYNAVEENEEENVNVYPNPAQGCFTVEGTGKLTITNLLGQEILVREIEGKTVVELPQGMYLVSLNNAVSKVVVK